MPSQTHSWPDPNFTELAELDRGKAESSPLSQLHRLCALHVEQDAARSF